MRRCWTLNKKTHLKFKVFFMSRQSTITVCTLLALVTIVATACSGSGRRPPDGERGKGRPEGRTGAMMVEAGPVATPVALFFTSLDKNADRVLNLDELHAGVAAEWSAIGADDGLRALQFADWSKLVLGSPDAHPAYVAFDNNFDGVISEEEFLACFEREFRMRDKDEDGALTRAELLSTIMPRRSGGQGGPGSRNGPPQGGKRPPGGGR